MHHRFIKNVKEKAKSTQQCQSEKYIAILSTKQLRKQRLLVTGYIRITCKSIFDESRLIGLLLSYSKFDGNPYTDPANYITKTELQMSSLYRKKGNVSFKNRQYQEAIIKYTTAFKFNPNDVRLYCNRSLCYLLLNETVSAYDDAFCAVKLSVTNPKCWYRLGTVSEKLNDLTTAFISYRTAKCISEAMHKNAQKMDQDIYRKFKAMKRKLNQRKYKTDKLWIHYFDECAIQESFDLKLQYYLRKTRLTKRQLLTKPYFSEYVYSMHDLFKMIHRSTAIKYIIHKAPIVDLQTMQNWTWCVSYTTFNAFESNKRAFLIDIVCQQTEAMEVLLSTFGIPSATQIISAMLQAMVYPSSHTHPYKPFHVLVAHRLKGAYEEVKNTMDCYGIPCTLEPKESAIDSSTNHNTHVDGFNYAYNREEYLKFNQICSNNKCEMTKKALWKISREKFKKCIQCKRATYCSRKCQKYHWKFGHNRDCGMF
eukprot:461139_1